MKRYTDWCTPNQLFKEYKVTDVKTVAEFLDHYYKHDRYKGVGDEYAAVVLASHKEDFERFGMDWISKFESRTGEVVSFYGEEL